MRPSIFRAISWYALLIVALIGCGQNESKSSTKNRDIAGRLRITTWDLDRFIGKTIRIAAKDESDGAVEFLVKRDTVLATQVASVHHAVTVFVLDQNGVGSTYISIGNRIDGLQSGDVAKGVLYEYNHDPVVTIVEIEKSSNNGMDTKGSIGRFDLR